MYGSETSIISRQITRKTPCNAKKTQQLEIKCPLHAISIRLHNFHEDKLL